MSLPLIRLRGITKVFGEGEAAFQALKGIDLDVAAGEFMAVMGASGSGKSTMMNVIGCLDMSSSGSFLFKGFEVSSLDRDQRALLLRRYLGFVFQGFNLLIRTSALLGAVAAVSLFAAVIGIVFGYFPARRAASLNPIDALRHE